MRHNIANAMAAAALAEGLGLPFEAIKAGLTSFHNTIEQSAGRFNVLEGYPFLLILDAAVKPPAAEALADCLTRLNVSGRRLCMITAVGNRPDWYYPELAAALKRSFDHFVCYDTEKFRRGRPRGEIANLLKSGLVKNEVRTDAIEVADDFESAVRGLSSKARAGDLVCVLGMRLGEMVPLIREAFTTHLLIGPRSAEGFMAGSYPNHANRPNT